MLSDLDNKFNPSGSGGDFGVFDQWLQVSMARFTKVLLVAGENIEGKAKEKATVTSNSNTTIQYNTIQYNVLYFERVDIHD